MVLVSPPPGPGAPFEVLRAYLDVRASFSPADFDVVREALLLRRLAAGEFLQKAGDVTRYAAFVATGCLRNYVIDAKGKEHIVQFAPETWWLADGTSLRDRTPSTYFIDAIEDSSVLLIEARPIRSSWTRSPATPPVSALACSGTRRRRISASSAH